MACSLQVSANSLHKSRVHVRGRVLDEADGDLMTKACHPKISERFQHLTASLPRSELLGLDLHMAESNLLIDNSVESFNTEL